MNSFQKKIGLAALVLLIGLLGCEDSKTEAAERTDNSAEASAKGADDDQPGESQGQGRSNEDGARAPSAPSAPAADVNVPAPDIYPGFNFGLLTGEQRGRFVAIAEAELCPCKDTTDSLHACLQTETRCAMATQVAGVIGSSIREGLNATDTLDRVAQFVEESQKTYSFSLKDVPFKGSADARVVIVEFADFQCPHCREAARVLDEVAKKYGDQIAIYFKQFPLGSPESQLAAQASLAAHIQGIFWPLHDLIFLNQTSINNARIERYARQLGLNYERFVSDMKSTQVAAAIQLDRQEGIKANLTGTPVIFINGRTYLEDKSPQALSRAIDAALKEASERPDESTPQ
ncbi:MAG: DsbA family protein [Bradymonadaceae bacterium]